MVNIAMIIGNPQGCSIYYFDHGKFVVKTSKQRAIHIIDKMMNGYYRTLKGNTGLISFKFHFVQKVPVFMEINRFLFFPTLSRNDADCCWINYYCVAGLKKKDDQTIVSLYDHRIIDMKHFDCHIYPVVLPYDIRILKNQMKRCHTIHNGYIEARNSMRELIEI